MLQSFHQNAEQFEIMFNKTKYDALPDKMQAIIANAVDAASADLSWKAIDRYSKDYIELQTKDNVKFYKTPDAILQQQLDDLRPGRREEVGGQPAVQGDRRVAEGVRRARGEVGHGQQRQPPHGVQPLLRRKGRVGAAQEGLSRSNARARHHPALPDGVFFRGPVKHRIGNARSHAEAAAVRRQGQHVRRPGLLLAHRLAHAARSRGKCSRATCWSIRTRGRST